MVNKGQVSYLSYYITRTIVQRRVWLLPIPSGSLSCGFVWHFHRTQIGMIFWEQFHYNVYLSINITNQLVTRSVKRIHSKPQPQHFCLINWLWALHILIVTAFISITIKININDVLRHDCNISHLTDYTTSINLSHHLTKNVCIQVKQNDINVKHTLSMRSMLLISRHVWVWFMTSDPLFQQEAHWQYQMSN